MKNFITRQIIMLMVLVTIFATALMLSTGVFLSDELFADIKSRELKSDVTVLTELAIAYNEGVIDQVAYESIVKKASEKNEGAYLILDAQGLVEYEEANVMTTLEHQTALSFAENLVKGSGRRFQLYKTKTKYYMLTGSNIVIADEIIGTVVVYADMVELTARKVEFYHSMMVSFIIVVPSVVVFSYIILKRIIRPIRNVAAVARSISTGDFAARADESQKGEIGLLSKAVNRLSMDIYKNISQLFIEKNRLEQVLNSLKDGMISIDESSVITHCNDIVIEMFGLTENIVGKSLNDILIMNDELFEISNKLDGNNVIVLRGYHDDIIIKVVVAPIMNEKDESVGAVVVFTDITELEKIELMRRDYVANVSHELRSPLTSIRGLIEPLMDKIVTNDNDVQRYHKIIYQESLRLSRLVDDIMELSRLQTHESNIEKRYLDLNLILEMVFERYNLYDERVNLVYKRVDLPNVYTNYDRIEQILVILLDNAFKFTSEGGRIEIRSEQRVKDVLITVKDTGEGISEEDLPFVFNRFYKADKSRTKKGTGLGLSIAKEILSTMDEHIRVRSVKGEGSVFEFTVGLGEVEL